ncbi:MAG: DNA-binding protein [Nitrososphaerota archaeon]
MSAYDASKTPSKEEQDRIKLREQYLKIFLTSEARERLTNVKMVKPEIASIVEDQILQLATSGRLRHPITDEELKNILSKFSPQRREFKIKFV